ncbi:MAG: hypothetical protein ACLS63_02610 [Flavonifractor plautii]
MDVKTLTPPCWAICVCSNTTLDIYTHVTGDMQTEGALQDHIGWGLGSRVSREAQEHSSQMIDFQPVLRKTCKTRHWVHRSVPQRLDFIRGALFPPPGQTAQSTSKCVYAHTREGVRGEAEGSIR